MDRDAELFRGVMSKVLFDERRSKKVKPSRHGCVGGEKISGARGGQRHFKWLRVRFHKTAGALQHGKGRVTFIQVTDIRLLSLIHI